MLSVPIIFYLLSDPSKKDPLVGETRYLKARHANALIIYCKHSLPVVFNARKDYLIEVGGHGLLHVLLVQVLRVDLAELLTGLGDARDLQDPAQPQYLVVLAIQRLLQRRDVLGLKQVEDDLVLVVLDRRYVEQQPDLGL